MLTTSEIVINACSLPLLILALVALAKGSPPPPEGSRLSRYFGAEKYLAAGGNLFLLAVCGTGMSKLAAHYGLIGPDAFTRVSLVLGVAFGVGLVSYLALWTRAIVRVRRAGSLA